MAPRPLGVLAIAAGGGGLELALRLALGNTRLVCAVEIEAYAAATLAAHMDQGFLDDAPIWSDARTFDGRPWRRRFHLLTAGYPCQPFSAAGKRKGAADPRHIWPHVARVIDESQPEGVFLENVEGHVSLGLREVLGDLRQLGYASEAGLFTAAECGASQIRKRIFIFAVKRRDVTVGQANGDVPRRAQAGRGRSLNAGHESEPGGGVVANGNKDGFGGCAQQHRLSLAGVQAVEVRQHVDGCAPRALEHASAERHGGEQENAQRRSGRRIATERPSRDGGAFPLFPPGPQDREAWKTILAADKGLAPAISRAVRRVADGMAGRVEPLRLLGNGVVPLAGAHAFRTLCAILAARGHPFAADLLSRSDAWLSAA